MIKIILSTLFIVTGLSEKNTTTIFPMPTYEDVTQTILYNHPPYVDAAEDPIIVETHVGDPEEYLILLDKIKDPDEHDLIYQVMYGNSTDLPDGISFIEPMLVVEGLKQASYNLTLVGTDPYGASAKLPILLSITPSTKHYVPPLERGMEYIISSVVIVGTGSLLGILLPIAMFFSYKENNIMKYLSVIELLVGGLQILTGAFSIYEGERIYGELIIVAGALNVTVGIILLVKATFDFVAACREVSYTLEYEMSVKIKVCLALSELATGGILIYADFAEVDELMSQFLSFFGAFNATSSFLINLIDSWEQNKLQKEREIENMRSRRESQIRIEQEQEEKKKLKKSLKKEKADHQLDLLKGEIISILRGIKSRNDSREKRRSDKKARKKARNDKIKSKRKEIEKIKKEGESYLFVHNLFDKKVHRYNIYNEASMKKLKKAQEKLKEMEEENKKEEEKTESVSKNEYIYDDYYALSRKMAKYGVKVSFEICSSEIGRKYSYEYDVEDIQCEQIKKEIQSLSTSKGVPDDFSKDLES